LAKKLYVGNLPYGISSSDLERVFQEYGTVESAQVIMDRDTGRSKGFGFVEMRNDQDAQEAIQGLHGQDFNGRPLTVNEARPREERGGPRREFGGSRARSGFAGGRRW
jgi:RNA recognition motif-containing protein